MASRLRGQFSVPTHRLELHTLVRFRRRRDPSWVLSAQHERLIRDRACRSSSFTDVVQSAILNRHAVSQSRCTELLTIRIWRASHIYANGNARVGCTRGLFLQSSVSIVKCGCKLNFTCISALLVDADLSHQIMR